MDKATNTKSQQTLLPVELNVMMNTVNEGMVTGGSVRIWVYLLANPCVFLSFAALSAISF